MHKPYPVATAIGIPFAWRCLIKRLAPKIKKDPRETLLTIDLTLQERKILCTKTSKIYIIL